MKEIEYVLGTDDEELKRLGLQHQVWRGEVFNLWGRAGFGPGQNLLDLGCGPGYTSRDLARVAGVNGSVSAIDLSDRFVSYVKSHPQERDSAPIDVRQGNIQALPYSDGHFDGAYTRWVLCFVPDPRKVIQETARVLKPGATLVIHDYVQYRAVQSHPRSDAFERVIRAVDHSWREAGGDPDVAAKLPTHLEAAGFNVKQWEPIVRFGRPGSLLWEWPTSFFRNYVPTLVKNGYLKTQDQEDFFAYWRERTNDPHSVFITPMVCEILAVKKQN